MRHGLRIASFVFMLAATVVHAADEGQRLCFSRAETRERIYADKLAEPFDIVRTIAGSLGAEALGAKLCRTNGMLVYEINLLDRTGRIIRATVDAATGRPSRESAIRRAEGIMRILVVEDDKDINRQLVSALTKAGYAIDRAFDGEEGQFLGETEPYDAVILDIGLPKRDGIAVLSAWRKAGRRMPVFILTARDRWSEKVEGFDAGADDYLAKPFHMEELLARLRALLRRATGHASAEIVCGNVRLDTKAGRVIVDGVPTKLTSHEYRLIAYLLHHSGRVVSRAEIIEHLYDQDFDRDSNTVEVFIGRLRKKIGADIIQTVRGLGYMAAPPDAPASEAR